MGFLLDCTFIQLDRMYLQGKLDERFSLDNESGYAEFYQNGKELGLALIAAAYLFRRKEPLDWSWFGIFTYVFADDTFQVHEKLGAWISARAGFRSAFGLRAVDFGELLVSATAGVLVCAALLTSWRRSGIEAPALSWKLVGLIVCLVFFGIVVDMVHVVATGPWQYRLGYIEDGGEMLIITILLWVMARHVPRRETHQAIEL